ncbi:tetratricopeptide repeat protein [Novosphingobium album (ex Liu et al. 2023)]|uniref:Cytochrome C biosynthesis protein n=1 Tax=Novosphingobium album (ex Liu et al. 2023) TaxID=3031130 RepID=A0ABT5WPV6_9SPHN|nr:cytochrome C biosynthesis protein [Novosphingobium album (ex Liu et al. 2023)]MDE8652054.1 cytochrome C biosynthesis protein [Novosphingobium album (ex Liu et al. 2023)]
MSWVLAFLLALAAFVVIAWVLKAPRSGWEAIGAALLFGIAGYGLQGSPGLEGAPKAAQETYAGDAAALVEARRKVDDSGIGPTDRLVVIADGLARNGHFADAAELLRGSVEENPKNGDAWLAMGNALVAHADGLLTPASLYAYRRAALAEPESPGPPLFLGLAMAQSGRFAEAKALWGDLLARAPADAPWRADLEEKLVRLDQFIAMQQQSGTVP